MVFDGMQATRNFSGYVLFLEEDHYLSPDFLFMTEKLIEMKDRSVVQFHFTSPPLPSPPLLPRLLPFHLVCFLSTLIASSTSINEATQSLPFSPNYTFNLKCIYLLSYNRKAYRLQDLFIERTLTYLRNVYLSMSLRTFSYWHYTQSYNTRLRQQMQCMQGCTPLCD